jgi:excisionase family DNA binding protein
MIKDGDFSDEQLLLDTVQAGRVLNVCRTTVYQLIKKGELHPVYLGRCCRISWAELERYVTRLDATNAAPATDPAPKRRWRRVATPSGQRALFPLEEAPSPGGDSAA